MIYISLVRENQANHRRQRADGSIAVSNPFRAGNFNLICSA